MYVLGGRTILESRTIVKGRRRGVGRQDRQSATRPGLVARISGEINVGPWETLESSVIYGRRLRLELLLVPSGSRLQYICEVATRLDRLNHRTATKTNGITQASQEGGFAKIILKITKVRLGMNPAPKRSHTPILKSKLSFPTGCEFSASRKRWTGPFSGLKSLTGFGIPARSG